MTSRRCWKSPSPSFPPSSPGGRTGFADPFKALEAIKASPPDLILSDQLMPGMQGSQLLEEARLAAPNALRVIMSGYIALDKLNLITSAHQYVAKPFDAWQLQELLRRTFAAHDRVTDKQLQTVVTSLRSLPSLPQVHHSLLAELNSSQGAGTSIGQMVAQDAGLSAKVLQLANSPLFGREYLVTNPVEAVLCLGTSMIASVVLSQSLFKHYRSSSHPEFSLSRIWSHCWETAALAQCYCGENGLARQAREEAFLAGLMHETGRLILIDNFPDQFQAACDAARRENSPLAPQLARACGAAPSQIAAYLLDLWGMPARGGHRRHFAGAAGNGEGRRFYHGHGPLHRGAGRHPGERRRCVSAGAMERRLPARHRDPRCPGALDPAERRVRAVKK